jgi:hypothetical protein
MCVPFTSSVLAGQANESRGKVGLKFLELLMRDTEVPIEGNQLTETKR